MIRGIIFDLDGTLGDTLPLCVRAFRASIEPLTSRSLGDAEIIATFGPSEEGTIRQLVPDHYEQALAAYLHHYDAMHDLCPAPFPGIPELLQFLKSNGIRIAMVTGKGPHSTVISLERFGLTSFFEFVETGSPSGPVKAAGIAAVLDRWKDLSPDDVIYVGDAPSDITASRKAGIAVIGAAWAPTAEPEQLKAMQPDELFFTVREFREWVGSKIIAPPPSA